MIEKTREKIGLLPLLIIGIGSTIGGGIFVLIAPGVEIAGEALPISFLVGGALALLVSFIYAEFSAALPEEGASLGLLFHVFGEKSGAPPFIIGWLMTLGDISYAAINALGFGYYAHLLVGIDPILLAAIALFCVFFLTQFGAQNASRVQNIVTGLLVAGLVIFTILIFDINTGPIVLGGDVGSGNFIPILSGAALVYTTFRGYEDIVALAGEAKNPGKNMPIALIGSLFAAIVIFFSVTVAALSIVPAAELAASDAPLFLVAEKIGWWGTALIFPLALLATFTSLITTILTSSRKIHAFAVRGFFYNIFNPEDRNHRHLTSLVVVSAIAFILVLTNSASFIAYLSNTVFLTTTILVSLGIIKLRIKRPFLERPFKVPFSPALLIIVMLFSLALLFFVDLAAIGAMLLWGFSGLLLYMASWLDKKRLKLALRGALIFILLISILVGLVFIVW